MNRTYILCGVAGSGKTTLGRRLAQRHGLKYLDADDFHPLENIEKMRDGLALEEVDREPWLKALEAGLKAEAGQPLLLAFPGLRAVHRARIERAAGGAHFGFLKVSRETARRRLVERG